MVDTKHSFDSIHWKPLRWEVKWFRVIFFFFVFLVFENKTDCAKEKSWKRGITPLIEPRGLSKVRKQPAQESTVNPTNARKGEKKTDL